MDLRKIGKFISEVRNEQGLTQKELSEKLGVGDKTISKWERGVNAPDISILQKLCKELDISVVELLNGERTENHKNNEVDFIKFYILKSKNKLISFFTVIILLVILIFIYVYDLSNYNKYEVYSVSSSDANYSLDGHVILNNEKNIIFISNIEYIDEYIGTDMSKTVDGLDIMISINDKIIYQHNYNYIDNNEEVYLENALKNIYIYFYEKKDTHENILLKNLDEIYLKIKYYNDDEEYYISIPLNLIKD